MRPCSVGFVMFFLRRYLVEGITQSQMSLVSIAGKSATITCDLDGASATIVHWYRQLADQRPERILYYESGVNNRDDGFDDRYSSRHVVDKQYSLTVHKLKTEDSATYFCAYWDTGAWRKIFGGGTRLIVTDETPKAPKIRLFPPSSDELRDTSKSVVVCLMTDFFPEVIKVEWKIGDVVQNDNVQTDSVTKMEKGNTYSLISRLSVSKLQWGDQPITCHAKHEIDVPGLKITKDSKYEVPNAGNPGGPTCPPSVQELQENTEEGIPVSSLQVATLTYTILLMKSVLYCGIISCILYKMEYWGTKKPL